MQAESKLLRLKGVQTRFPLGRSALYEQQRKGLFPRPVPLAGRAVGWYDHEVSAIIDARAARKSDEDLRTLVRDLEAKRATLA